MSSGAAPKRPVRITILDQTYTVLAPGEDRELLELADSVNELMAIIAARSPKADNLRVAVLACLHLADRLRSLQKELGELKLRVDEKSRAFQLLLDEAIREADG